MPILIKIAILYGAPGLAVVLAVVAFVVSYLRVRAGKRTRASAIATYAATLLLPFLALLVVWLASDVSSFREAAPGASWSDYRPSIDLLKALLPLAGYLLIPIALLNVAFWVVARPRPVDGNRM